jgi:hypothetical protein
MAVVGSSKEHNVDITGNKVTALRAPQHFRRQKELTTRSNRRTMMGIFGATFAHIYYTIRTSPFRLRSSIDALQEVGIFPLYRLFKNPLVVSECSAWTLPRRPIPTKRCLA